MFILVPPLFLHLFPKEIRFLQLYSPFLSFSPAFKNFWSIAVFQSSTKEQSNLKDNYGFLNVVKKAANTKKNK